MDIFFQMPEHLERRRFLSGSVVPALVTPVDFTGAVSVNDVAERVNDDTGKPGPCIVDPNTFILGEWTGEIYSKNTFIATVRLNIQTVDFSGTFHGELTYQPLKGEALIADVVGTFSHEKGTFSLSWGVDRSFYGSMSGTLSIFGSRSIEVVMDFSDASGRSTYTFVLGNTSFAPSSVEPVPNEMF